MVATIKKIISVTKTNSTYGSWAVTCIVKFPWTTTQHTLFYYDKKTALAVSVGDTIDL